VIDLDGVPGRISVWCGPLDTALPWYRRLADEPHYPASLMKVPLMVAAYRAHEAGEVDLDAQVPVRNRFASAVPGAPEFGLPGGPENDPSVWQVLDETATLRWLCERMIVASSNLAANVLWAHVGAERVAEVWRRAGATGSAVLRAIDDRAARESGIDNVVTAIDLARLFDSLGTGRLAGDVATAAMLDTLAMQERREDLPSGLPDGVRVAFKNGWVSGVRHAGGIVYPDGRPPFTLVVCATTPLAEDGHRKDGADEACRLLARIAEACWQRSALQEPGA
jgi:beta-lactamase class A